MECSVGGRLTWGNDCLPERGLWGELEVVVEILTNTTIIISTNRKGKTGYQYDRHFFRWMIEIHWIFPVVMNSWIWLMSVGKICKMSLLYLSHEVDLSCRLQWVNRMGKFDAIGWNPSFIRQFCRSKRQIGRSWCVDGGGYACVAVGYFSIVWLINQRVVL